MISCSFGCSFLQGLLPITKTEETSGCSRHSKSVPCPIIPLAPKIMTFISCLFSLSLLLRCRCLYFGLQEMESPMGVYDSYLGQTFAGYHIEKIIAEGRLGPT